MLDDLSIRSKSLLLMGIALFMCLFATGMSLRLLNSAFQQETREIVKAVTDTAYGVVESQYQRYQSGELSETQARAAALSQLRQLRYRDDGYLFVFEDGVVALQPFQPEKEGSDMTNARSNDGRAFVMEMTEMSRNGGAGYVEYQWQRPETGNIGAKVSYVRGFTPWNWTLGTGIYNADAREVVINWLRNNILSILAMCAAFVLLISMIYLMNRSFCRRASHVREHLRRFADGDFSQPVSRDGNDEFGLMLVSLQQVQQHMSRTLAQLTATIESVNRNMQEIAASNNNLAQRTESQANNLAESTQNLSSIASNVRQNSNSVQEANQLAKSARETVRQGSDVVGKAVSAMDSITRSSSRVNDIVDVIDDIAFQTNLLALNASVEAARAGEQGKGFAVVAAEVRNLAQRSAASAHEIKQLIQASGEDVKRGSELVNCSGQLLQEILDKSARVSEHLQDIAAATEQQALGVENTSSSVIEIDDFVQRNAAMVEQVAVASQTLLQEMDELQVSMAYFHVNSRDQANRDSARVFTRHAAGSTHRHEADGAGDWDAPASLSR